ncbi:hypothetical protein, partial [Paenibacillus xylanexedens]|uniref:hypothetical protein n=1 Tax=Paenibacillus xylanexedens TaxID=528191 RepID=UPI001C92D133
IPAHHTHITPFLSSSSPRLFLYPYFSYTTNFKTPSHTLPFFAPPNTNSTPSSLNQTIHSTQYILPLNLFTH